VLDVFWCEVIFLVRWWVDDSWVVLLWLICGVVGGVNWTSHLLVGVGLALCICGDGCAGGRGC